MMTEERLKFNILGKRIERGEKTEYYYLEIKIINKTQLVVISCKA